MNLNNIALLYSAKKFLEPPSYIYEDDGEELLLALTFDAEQRDAKQRNVKQDRKTITKRKYADVESPKDTATPLTEAEQLITKYQSYMAHTIPPLNDKAFRVYFGVSLSTFEFILNEVGDKLYRSINGNEMIPAEKQLLVCLRRYATATPYSIFVNDFHKIGKSTAVRSVHRVTRALCELQSKYITWPNKHNFEDVIRGFYNESGFPDTIGAIGSTYITVSATRQYPQEWVNRKGFHSIFLQAVCDHRNYFTHVSVGSIEDARSAIFDYINDPEKFPNNTHIIGNAAYGLSKRILVPYPENGLRPITQREKNYNAHHNSGRTMIDKAFALLKGRWKSIQNTLSTNNTKFLPSHILACCVLHNMCILNGDTLESQHQAVVIDTEEDFIKEKKINCNDRSTAEIKRNNICSNLEMII